MSLLTDTPDPGGSDQRASASDIRDAFSAAFVTTLAELAKRGGGSSAPGVVLMGDIFDLSLGTPQSSIRTFDQFLTSLGAAGARDHLGQFIFIPGNHDHELWTATRFQNMVGGSAEGDRFGHTTRAFADAADQPRATQIDALLRSNGFAGATTFYPNMAQASADNERVVVLHHGHFVEPMYRAMSTLTAMLDGKTGISLDAETLEELNSSWIDFVWSTDGDNGRLGADIMLGYHEMMTGGASIRLDHKLGHILAAKLMATLPLPKTAIARKWAEAAAKALVDSTLGNYAQLERFSYQDTLGADSLAGLRSYLSGTVLGQITNERPDLVVNDLTFVFGHTHKPFETRVVTPGIARPPAVYNSGGWVLSTPMFGTRLGASAVFIDDDLNTASLRLCDVPQVDEESPPYPPPAAVRVVTADGTSADNPMAEALQASIDATRERWNRFSVEAAKAYRAKQTYAMELTGSMNAGGGAGRSTA